ncbi:MAG: hypothetical protein JWQ50_7500 [Caballeronia mineralivorans]|jgi:hypothetical protein|nr:hypothetical protein [Caballeronia mineralivorans]
MNAKLTDADVFVLVTPLLNKMDHPDLATVRSEVEILINLKILRKGNLGVGPRCLGVGPRCPRVR